MNFNMAIVYCVLAGSVVFAKPVVEAADLPPMLRSSIDKSVESYTETIKAADKNLLLAFQKQIMVTSRLPNATAGNKQSQIDALKVEMEDFEKYGTLPFSPAMRKGATDYINRIMLAKKRAESAYNRGILYFQKTAKDPAAASELNDEMRKVLAPRHVGTWEMSWRGGMYRVAMYLDGTASLERTWEFSPTGITIRHHIIQAPGGAYVHKGVIHFSGKRLETKDQFNTVTRGVLSNPGR